jgi:hypothetical protein
MNYPINIQIFNFKYKIFWTTQKRQMCESGYAYFKSPNFNIFCLFCVAYNVKSFILKFYTLVGYVIYYVQICF